MLASAAAQAPASASLLNETVAVSGVVELLDGRQYPIEGMFTCKHIHRVNALQTCFGFERTEPAAGIMSFAAYVGRKSRCTHVVVELHFYGDNAVTSVESLAYQKQLLRLIIEIPERGIRWGC